MTFDDLLRAEFDRGITSHTWTRGDDGVLHVGVYTPDGGRISFSVVGNSMIEDTEPPSPPDV